MPKSTTMRVFPSDKKRWKKLAQHLLEFDEKEENLFKKTIAEYEELLKLRGAKLK